MTPIDFHPAADREVRHARRWYAARSGPTAARFHAEFWRTAGAVSHTPTAFSPLSHGTRFAPLRKFPYYLVFVVEPSLVFVLAVVHTSRRPGYWFRRLPGEP